MRRFEVTRIFKSIPELNTERLKLRRIKLSDSRDMYEYSRLEEVTRYLLWEPHTELSETMEHLRRVRSRYEVGEYYDWALVSREDRRMIGTCGFSALDFDNNSAEVGYVLHPDYWGRGLAPEALRRVLDFGFMELNLHRIEARYMVENRASRRVMEKCGMSFEGVKRSSLYVKGSYRDIGTCSILSEEYIQKYI